MISEPNIIDAIVLLKPDAQVLLRDEDYDTIIWEDGNPTGITNDQIATKLVELRTEYNAQAYARNRKEEYDALNQFELISDDDVNGTTTHKDAIAAIKTKYPKG